MFAGLEPNDGGLLLNPVLVLGVNIDGLVLFAPNTGPGFEPNGAGLAPEKLGVKPWVGFDPVGNKEPWGAKPDGAGAPPE